MKFTNIKEQDRVTGLRAVGDGIADDTRAIQAHIDSVKDAGGTVYFPPGDYLVSQGSTEGDGRFRCLELCSNVTYLGSRRSSRIVLRENQPNSVRMLATEANGTHHVAIRNLHLDGNRDRQNPDYEQLHAILLRGARDCLIEGCLIHDTIGDGVYGYLGEEPFLPGCPFPRTASTNLSVLRNEFYGIGRVGVNFAGASFSEATGNFFYDPTRNRPFWAFKMEINNNFGPEGYPGYAMDFLRGNKFIGNRMRDVGGLAVSSSRDVKAIDLLFADNIIEMTLAEEEFFSDNQFVPIILDGVIGVRLSGNVIDIILAGNTFDSAGPEATVRFQPVFRSVVVENRMINPLKHNYRVHGRSDLAFAARNTLIDAGVKLAMEDGDQLGTVWGQDNVFHHTLPSLMDLDEPRGSVLQRLIATGNTIYSDVWSYFFTDTPPDSWVVERNSFHSYRPHSG